MIRLENRNYLRFSNRSLLERLNRLDEAAQDTVLLEPARNGEPTLKKKIGSAYQYIHSRYNPIREAESLVAAMGDLQDYNHVLFIGSGLGYLIKIFAAAYTEKEIYIFEPDPAVLNQFLTVQNLSEPWAANIRFISDNADEILQSVGQAIHETGKPFYFSVLPFNERNDAGTVDRLLTALREGLLNKKSALVTDFSFQQRWILNAVNNFSKILETPNMLMDIDPSAFKGKAVLLIAAGPSLNDEFDHLKKIKAEGSAYLFAVGSAINALLRQEIIPDAVLSYDPGANNYRVLQLAKDRHLENIPFIFGSTVGFETIQNYAGPMLHLINIQDTLSPLLLKRIDGKPIEAVNDAPSIAVITLQTLIRLKASPIILVGQNLAYSGDKFYAQGISYQGRPEQLSENDKKAELTVQSVDGAEIRTNRTFNSMRREMELYLAQNPNRRVINTTRGGAAIAGAPFQPLEQVMRELTPGIVVDKWYDCKNDYDAPHVSERIARLIWQGRELKELFEKVIKALRRLKTIVDAHVNADRITAQIEKANHDLQRMQKNNFYKRLIAPMMRVQVEHFNKVGADIRALDDPHQKAETALKELNTFLNECVMNYQGIFPLVEQLREKCGDDA